MYSHEQKKLGCGIFQVLFCEALAALILCSSSAVMAESAEESAPAFSVLNEHSHLTTQKDFKGHYVVLEWFNNECPFVKKHYQSGNMQALQKKWISQKVRWITVLSSAPKKQGSLNASELEAVDSSWKSPTERKNTRLAKPSRTTALFDSDGTMAKAFGATATPYMVVIAPNQKIIYKGAIDDQPSSRLETIKIATNYVSLALEQHMKSLTVQKPQTKVYGCSIKFAD